VDDVPAGVRAVVLAGHQHLLDDAGALSPTTSTRAPTGWPAARTWAAAARVDAVGGLGTPLVVGRVVDVGPGPSEVDQDAAERGGSGAGGDAGLGGRIG